MEALSVVVEKPKPTLLKVLGHKTSSLVTRTFLLCALVSGRAHPIPYSSVAVPHQSLSSESCLLFKMFHGSVFTCDISVLRCT